ncbi:hypothetical protein M2459_000842 [Parabacteroides sp. PF5-5]|uniref:DUF3857 domain-containing protein n=1 Tax=unclassified Parabacteroides TaxID=2649774 RepID=UPI0024733DAC|nr:MULTISPECIES: DUF3857 domain-containing protein [unclassified Parabacteroides]MDH6304130.1 hypothetical protein [Parabacteroides sp. PH5-39]MDH6315170.1 hypothetical protein [Parabacteroides sp. PF5-13]MDH6318815.1 hypothetical protein [Parabacteroides sp. PH5-13]MDH6322544.1 hypothetical protein [Parabacteroides sp. PH5-8]MDH6326304.1 hypothetical protein [Parabacteroides sp. PH5-41]
MKKIYILFLLLIASVSLFAASEAEYGVLSKTYTLHSDGIQEFRYNMELTIFTHTAMNRTYGESFIVYNPKFQELKIHTSYTKQKDGTIIKTPENAFVEVLPRQAANAPAYNHLKEMVVVHTGLELGATIYLDYSIVSKAGYLPELDLCEPIEQTSPVKDYTLTISVPESKPLFYSLVNSNVKPSESTANGVKQVSWKIRNLPAASMAPQVTALGGDRQILLASTYASNQKALETLNAQFAPERDMPMLSLSETLTEGLTSDTEKIYALLKHVTDNVGFSRLSLQETAFRIRSTDDVVTTAYGTEVEKLNMLAALLNASGIKAETVAAYYTPADQNCYGLSAVADWFILASADGKQFLLTPKQMKMSDAGWYSEYAQYISLTNPGKKVNFQTPSTKLDYTYTITLSPDKADIQANATIGEAFIPYTNKGKATVSEKTEQKLKNNNGYILLSLPEAPNSISNAAYKNYNSKRNQHLLVPYKATESISYTIQLPAGMELSTPATTKTTDNAAGKASYTITQNGNSVEVKRNLEMKKQLITPADYAAFRNLMVEWADINKRQLLIKMK